MVSLSVLVGLPAAGKTTLARRIAHERRAVRLSPDEWMIPLFGDSDAGGRRDVLEGRLVSVAVQLLRVGTGAVLDFGCWGRDERSALRWIARDEGAAFELVYLPVDRDTQLARIAGRAAHAPHTTFPMTADDLDRWRAQFQVPDAAELAGTGGTDVPAPWSDWWQWAADRWPSLSRD